ncbi:MAG: hypothetical protein DRJ47_04750 [Thermoprotei archaeon]|nr:MAG: hypothetical protein DRJ47_04750 [Thermoprotei archaeon]
MDPNAGPEENTKSILEPGTYLYDKAINFLRQEVKEPQMYLSILAAVAEGRQRSSEVASMAKIDPRGLTKYIVVLEELDILERG